MREARRPRPQEAALQSARCAARLGIRHNPTPRSVALRLRRGGAPCVLSVVLGCGTALLQLRAAGTCTALLFMRTSGAASAASDTADDDDDDER